VTHPGLAIGGAVVGMLLSAAGALAADLDVSAPAPPSAVPGRVIVEWSGSASGAQRAAARAGSDTTLLRTLGDRRFQLLKVDADQAVGDAIAELAGDPAVLRVGRDGYSELHAPPDDPHFGDLWGLRNLGVGVAGFPNPVAGADIDVLGAWIRTVGSPSTVVAVLDTGYRFNHPDLGPVAWTNADEPAGNGVDDDGNGYVDDVRGYDFVGPSADSPAQDGDPTDDDLLTGGHGVHTAGTVGAAGNDGVGITGVAQDVRIMPLRVCAHSPASSPPAALCPFSSQIAAINYAGANGARVANMSLGGTTFNGLVRDALAHNPQTLFVISAGNDQQSNDAVPHYPCNYDPTTSGIAGAVDNVVCVAATDQADGLAGFSDWGATTVDLGAPGTETLSAYPKSDRYLETFEADDFAAKWTATGAGGGFARASEAPLTSFGMTDTPGGPPTTGTRESLSAPVSIPAGLGSCTLSQRRALSVGVDNQYRYAVLLNGSVVFQSAAVTASGSISTVAIPELNAGGDVQIRQRYVVGAPSPAPSDGVWLDDIRLSCFQPVGSTAATYAFSQGTSMAAPHVAGVAALLFSLEPTATVAEARNALLASVDQIPALAGKTVTGGRLDASSALDVFDHEGPPPPQLGPTDPASPANANAPKVRGAAEQGSTVRLYATSDCSGSPVATGSAAALASPGLAVTVADDSTVSIRSTATDSADNASPCSAPLVYVEDSLPPQTAIDAGPTGLTQDRTPTFGFASEPGATFQCSVDATVPSFSTCSGPGATHTPSSLADGTYVLRVRATDQAGNVDPTPATRDFAVDATAPPPPQLTATAPASPANDNAPKVKGTAEAGATVQLYASAGCGGTPVTGSAATLGSGGIAFPGIADDASAAFSAVAADVAGNVSSCSASLAYVEDSTAPDSSITLGPSGATDDSTPTFGYASEPGADFECSVDAGVPAFGPCSGPGSAHTPSPALAEGAHVFRVRAADAAGNVDPTPASRAFSVVPPVLSPPGPTAPGPGPFDPAGPLVPTSPLVSPALARCVVPALRGRTLARARKALRAARCTLGRVRRPKSRRGGRAPVVRGSKPKAGTELPQGAKVAVTLAPTKPAARR
jgi:subtilisin family serine protease